MKIFMETVKIKIYRRSHAEKLMTPLQFYKFGLADETSNDIIAGNGRILKADVYNH